MSDAPALLPHELFDERVRRLAALSALVAAAVVLLQVFLRLMQPQLAAVLDDPLNRLAVLSTALMGAALFALQRYRIVASSTLLGLVMLFEIVVAFSIGMIETSRPFDVSSPLIGLSAVGPLILFAGLAIPNRPAVRLGIAVAAASTWPLAYWINATRFGFATESWRQTSIWPLLNYAFALLAYRVGRSSDGPLREYSNHSAAERSTTPELGSYQLLWPIGEGGMGEVWRASHNLLARPAAIKLIKFDAGREEVFARRFQREANAIAGLQSPHTVYLYDFGTTREGRLYYVMELLDGISLQTLITTFGPQPAPRVVAILRQMCRSLGEAHEKQIVHRDLKPSNVMICQVAQTCDFVKVLDFGLAKTFGGTEVSPLTMEGVTLGTPEYMAPEVARADPAIDARADLYALGCVAYFLLTGTLVFIDPNPVGVALKHMRTPPDPPSQRTSQFVSSDLEGIILKCLEKDPGARPASAREVLRMLAATDVPPWTDEDAAAWWDRHLPPTSPLRTVAGSRPPPSN